MICVVDTNVPVVANGKSKQASPQCVIFCTQRLLVLTNSGKLVLDDQWRIIKEYLKNLRSEGQPGVGDAFLKWVLTNMSNPNRCELVSITPINSNGTNFKEFPSDFRLRNFDPSDRKFIAVAFAHSQHPPILQAVDSKWWKIRDILLEHDIIVEFLCPADI